MWLPWPGQRWPTRRRRWVLLLVAGWLVQAGLRAWLSRAQMVPLATPDESAYLISARVISGGVTADFSYSTLYPAGYPLLITPVFWFTHNPVTVYHAVLLGINAPLSALVMPLGYVACRRLGLERPWAFGVAMVAALLPAALFYSQYAMTDAIFPVLVLGWLLAVHSWLTARSCAGLMSRPSARPCWPGTRTRCTPGARSWWPGFLWSACWLSGGGWCRGGPPSRPRWRCACRWARPVC